MKTPGAVRTTGCPAHLAPPRSRVGVSSSSGGTVSDVSVATEEPLAFLQSKYKAE